MARKRNAPETQEEAIPEIRAKSDKKDAVLVTLDVPVPVKINGVRYFGRVKVSKAVAEVIAHMAFKKQKADLRVFTGKNFQVSRLLDNTLVVKEEGV